MTRDPDLGRLLEAALPPGSPRPGAEERVLERIRQRQGAAAVAVPARRRPRVFGALALALASVLGSGLAVEQWWTSTPEPPAQRDLALDQMVTLPAPRANEPAAPRRLEARAGDEAIVLGRDVRLLARAGTVLEVSERTSLTECRLVVGEVLVHVPEGSKDGFSVVTSTTRVDVTGTVFGVGAKATGATAVTVWNGRVRVSGGEAPESLEAGQHWPLGTPRLRATGADMELLAASGRVELTDLEPARFLEPPEPHARRAPSRAALSRAALSRGALSRGALSRAALSATPRARSEAAPAARDLYARARDVEASGDRREAARLYERAAREDERAAGEAGPTAEAAAFAAARLYSGLAEHALAQRVLTSYRAQHPNGLYARAADVLWLRALVAEGDSVGVEREAERFLRNYPDDPRAGQFRAARALDRARRGRCVEARSDLRDVEQAVLDRLEKSCPLRPLTPDRAAPSDSER